MILPQRWHIELLDALRPLRNVVPGKEAERKGSLRYMCTRTQTSLVNRQRFGSDGIWSPELI
jgi:hypothetical protein